MIYFFDIDGTLSKPLYMKDRHKVNGGSEAWWFRYNIYNNNTYEYCKPVKMLQSYIRDLKESGNTIFVLTTETNSCTFRNKCKFIIEHYGDSIELDNIHFVSDKYDKIKFMLEVASSKNLDADDITFVDDDFTLITMAADKGINAIHISHFLD